MNRGDVWTIDLGGRTGTRPVVILTRNAVIPYINKVVVVEITSRSKGYPTEVAIGQRANLTRESFVQADNLHTVPKHRLRRFHGNLDEATMDSVSKAVVLALGLEDARDQV
ncbi:MAG: type II toxin-antitoxin system PemK/MazF family toxin [Alkalispirochaeta sp.]